MEQGEVFETFVAWGNKKCRKLWSEYHKRTTALELTKQIDWLVLVNTMMKVWVYKAENLFYGCVTAVVRETLYIEVSWFVSLLVHVTSDLHQILPLYRNSLAELFHVALWL